MPIPETLSARRTELERMIEAHQIEIAEHAEHIGQRERDIAILQARLEELDASNAAHAAAVTPTEAPPVKQRRDLRKLVLDTLWEAEAPISTECIRVAFDLKPYQARQTLFALKVAGKITGDDNGWRLVRGEGAPGDIKLAAE